MNFIRRWLATLFLAAAQLGTWLARKVAPARKLSDWAEKE
jgi:hypothetical protein